mmetsp:Transcript_10522/g.15693  ORF Transcript_10522/g.15693 Transcript_10522/m.15693 type:complete len:84 (-) Transcript_10522:203-454(-)
MSGEELRNAAEEGDLAKVSQVLREYPRCINEVDSNNNATALILGIHDLNVEYNRLALDLFLLDEKVAVAVEEIMDEEVIMDMQ